jgi:hypothetical protein
MARFGVAEAAEAARGGNPVHAQLGFDHIVDVGIGKTVGCAVVFKAVAVESRKPPGSAEPEKTSGIADDSMDRIVSEALGSCIDLRWKTLGMSQRP